jgi:serine/threonine-protein kinase
MRKGAIGRFEVLGRISRGGMADVYRCRVRGIGGFEKIVAVKRIRAERASDPDFVTMFLDEARLAGNLSHPNIVQVFEIGEASGHPYLAMEYVDGPTLSQLLREARRSDRLALGPLVKILGDVAAGLHHAHSAVGASGEPLGLVHRDVSPQNILVSREGVPKLLDFGVAKANGRLTETQAGTLKGKLRYMAPEQLQGPVDHRADVFALGVCLFEATTGQSPFGPAHLDEITLFQNIISGKSVRPSRLVPAYPRLLEEIVMWTLDPALERRCPSAWELHESLEEVVTTPGPLASSTRAVRDWVRQVCPAAATEVSPERTSAAETGFASRPDHPSQQTPVEQLTVLSRGASAGGKPRRAHRFGALGLASIIVAAVLGGAIGRYHGWPAPQAPPVAAGAYVRNPSAAAPPRPLLRKPDVPVAAAPPPTAPMANAPGPARPARDVSSKRRRATPPALPAAASYQPSPPAPATAAPRVEATGAAAPERILSATPHADVPLPSLPRVYRPDGAEDLRRVLASVEAETIRAGCSPPFARGITRGLEEALRNERSPELYPAAIYYFIVREAALGREKQVAAAELGRAHSSGVVRALSRLPVALHGRL